ncbi:hypothetical protein CK203_098147 [Vitis vinifera]|uniref:DUF659 domain-containing protein n=1 Tax=Vitis vinifera TaxID=29760 RepID=A0A438C668_VITVI|nr:hypothetical protein CK203_098147 [Vitis vinifera]
MKAGKQLMKMYNLYWTPCAVHDIDLIFEDISKRPSVIEVINNARKITNFIYNHGWLLAQMRKYCGGDIVRPGATRRGVGSDLELLQAIHDVFAKLDPTTESLGQLEMSLYFFEMQKEDSVIERNCSKVNHGARSHSESFSKDIDDSLHAALNSHQEIDSTSTGHSSRLSAASTSASGYDGLRGGTDDGGDNGGGDIDECRHSQYPISQFTCENDFTHCTQDEDHGSRRAGPGIGAIRKPYRGREQIMEPYNEELLSGSFESMSIGTQFSDSSNEANVYPPHVMSYGQPPSSTDEE